MKGAYSVVIFWNFSSVLIEGSLYIPTTLRRWFSSIYQFSCIPVRYHHVSSIADTDYIGFCLARHFSDKYNIHIILLSHDRIFYDMLWSGSVVPTCATFYLILCYTLIPTFAFSVYLIGNIRNIHFFNLSTVITIIIVRKTKNVTFRLKF